MLEPLTIARPPRVRSGDRRRAVAHIGAPARQAIREIGVTLQIVAPRLAQSFRRFAAVDRHRRDGLAFSLTSPFRGGLGAAAGRPEHRDESHNSSCRRAFLHGCVQIESDQRQQLAVTHFRQIDFPGAQKILGQFPFDSINCRFYLDCARQTNLCTRTLRFCPMRKARSVA